MTILFAGSELEAFTVSGTVAQVTTAGKFDSAYQRSAIVTSNNAAEYFETLDFGAQTELWVHANLIAVNGTGASYKLLELVNSSGTPVFRFFKSASNGTVQAQYWDGATWVNTGTAFASILSGQFDLYILCGASGAYELYLDNVLYDSGAIADADTDNVAKARFYGLSSSSTQTNRAHWSEIIVATETTIQFRLLTNPPTGNGAQTAWANDYTAVDEIGVSDADFISGAANGDTETFTAAARTFGSFGVKAVAVTARARIDTGGGPQNMQAVLRKGGTDYPSASVAGLGLSFNPYSVIWETDPSTAAAWTDTAAKDAALEFGVKAIT